MLGSFGNSLGNHADGALRGRPPLKAAATDAKKREQQLNQLLEHEWSELPYTMMRITAARRPWDGNRVYWRDRTVQLGDIDLNLLKRCAEDDAPGYTAVYTTEELRREFTLHPSLEDDELRWSAPEISDGLQLTTQQLAEKLLGKLVTFYTTSLLYPATSSASPDPSS